MEVTFIQIAGLLARRIVFNLRAGDTVARGQRVGLIKFGSRVNVLLPAEADVLVKVGQRVQGGSTVLASMAEAEAVLAAGGQAVKRSTSVSVQFSEGDSL
jgi:phosphatidylserine decarboxylase